MRTSTLLALGLGLAACSVRAAVVTNSETLVISTATELSGVTNIYTHQTIPAQIDADLTLDNRSYVRFWGANPTGVVGYPTDTKPALNIGTTPEDVTLTIKGNSLFAATYRHSKSPEAWANAHIDVNGNAASSLIRVHLGVPDAAPGSTGRVKIDIQTKPGFGGNAFGGFWAEWLYVNSSVTPNESGYIDFLELSGDTTADIAAIDNLNAAPARILFRNGQLLRNNVNSHVAPLAVSAGHELILEGVSGYYVEYCKQFSRCDFTARKGGTVRFRGGEVRLRGRGNCTKTSDLNFVPWRLSKDDNVVWENTGDLYLMESCYLSLTNDCLLPHGADQGRIRFHYNTSSASASSYGVSNYVHYCLLDIGTTTQYVNGLVSDSQLEYCLGVVSNVPYTTGTSTARGKVIFGEHDLSPVFNARCTAGVDVEKIGKGNLSVRHAYGETLAVKEGSASFSEDSAFDTLDVAAGAAVSGEVLVNGAATFAAGADASILSLALGANGVIKAAGAMAVESLKVNGMEVPHGEYTAGNANAAWLHPDSAAVTVIRDSALTTSAVAWTGAGADNLVTTPENWSAAASFANPVTIPEFAQGGNSAVFSAAVSYLGGLIFNAAGDFTLSGSDGANALALYGALTLGGEGTRTYKVDMPVKLRGDKKTITMPANDLTLHLRDLSGMCAIDIVGTKLSAGTYDYSTNGVIILENARAEGNIDHTKGGGTIIFRGDVGVVNEIGTYNVDYGRYRDPNDKTAGWCETGKTRLENVVFHKKIAIKGGGSQNETTGANSFLCFGGQTNRFKAQISESSSSTVSGEGGTVNIFEKGFVNTAGTCAINGWNSGANKATAEKPAVFIFDSPIAAEGGQRLEFIGNYLKVIFRTQRNYARFQAMIGGTGNKLEFTVDDAFIDTDFYFSSATGTMDLSGTHQKVRSLLSAGQSEAAANMGIITSVEPATLEVTGGAPSRECCVWKTDGNWLYKGITTNSTQQISGAVSLVKSGAGYLFMNRNGQLDSTGALVVNGGTVEFAARTAWPNASAVTVTGTGALVLGKGDIFGKKTPLHLSGEGTLTLADGTDEESGAAVKSVMRVEELYLDGALAKPGVYGAIGDEGADYPTSHILSGRVRVLNLGTRIFLR